MSNRKSTRANEILAKLQDIADNLSDISEIESETGKSTDSDPDMVVSGDSDSNRSTDSRSESEIDHDDEQNLCGVSGGRGVPVRGRGGIRDVVLVVEVEVEAVGAPGTTYLTIVQYFMVQKIIRNLTTLRRMKLSGTRLKKVKNPLANYLLHSKTYLTGTMRKNKKKSPTIVQKNG
jgi:hypothetical protein